MLLFLLTISQKGHHSLVLIALHGKYIWAAEFRQYDNMLQELSDRTKHHKPVWRISRRCSSQPLALSRVFILHTSHFTTSHSSSEYLCDSSCFVVTLCHTHVHSQTLFFSLHIPNPMLITALRCPSLEHLFMVGMWSWLSCRAETEKDETRLHSSLSTSGTFPGATCQKIYFRFKGTRGACRHACWGRCCLKE